MSERLHALADELLRFPRNYGNSDLHKHAPPWAGGMRADNLSDDQADRTCTDRLKPV
jgi:hypothetical protein